MNPLNTEITKETMLDLVGASGVDKTVLDKIAYHDAGIDWRFMPENVYAVQGVPNLVDRGRKGSLYPNSLTEKRERWKFGGYDPSKDELSFNHHFGYRTQKINGGEQLSVELKAKAHGVSRWTPYSSQTIGISVPSTSTMRKVRQNTFLGLPVGTIIHHADVSHMIISKYNANDPMKGGFNVLRLNDLTHINRVCPRLSLSGTRMHYNDIGVNQTGDSMYRVGIQIPGYYDLVLAEMFGRMNKIPEAFRNIWNWDGIKEILEEAAPTDSWSYIEELCA